MPIARIARASLSTPPGIEFVLLTHAHIDHSGLLPRLLELGFRGPVYATAATCDLLSVMLPDAAYVQEREAEPLYTVPQANASLRLLRPIEYDQPWSSRAPGLRCRFRDAGHILGSAIIELWSTSEGGSAQDGFQRRYRQRRAGPS